MVQLQVLNDIVRNKKDGTQKLIAKNIKCRIWVRPDRILSVGEIIRNKNNIYKTRCEVSVENVGNLIVNINVDKLIDLLSKNKPLVGYVRR